MMIPANRNRTDQRLSRIEELGFQDSRELQETWASELRQSISLQLHDMDDYGEAAERPILMKKRSEVNQCLRKPSNLRRWKDNTFPHNNDYANHTKSVTDHIEHNIDHDTNQRASPAQGDQGLEPDLAMPQAVDAVFDSSDIASCRRLRQRMKCPKPEESAAAATESLISSAFVQTEEDYQTIKKNMALLKKPKTQTAGKVRGNVNSQLMDFNRHLMNRRRCFTLSMVTAIIVFLIAIIAISYTHCVLAKRPPMSRIGLLVHSIIETLQRWIYGYSSDNLSGRLVRCANRAVLCPWPLSKICDWAVDMVRKKIE